MATVPSMPAGILKKRGEQRPDGSIATNLFPPNRSQSLAAPPPPTPRRELGAARSGNSSVDHGQANCSPSTANPFATAPLRPSPGPQNGFVPGGFPQGSYTQGSFNQPPSKPSSPAPFIDRSETVSPPPNSQAIASQTVSSKDPKAAAQAASDMKNVVRRKLTGYVGFANLPNQWHRKSVRKGFNFNVMVVGMNFYGFRIY